jgi:serine O-acetyltransferase
MGGSPLALTGATDVVVVLALPLLALMSVWLMSSIAVFARVRLSHTSALRADLEHRIDARRRTVSGHRMNLSFLYVAGALAGDNCVQATVLYRIGHTLVRWRLRMPARAVHAFSRFATHADISPRAEIGPGLYLYHGMATVVGKGTVIGRNALICQQVTTGGGPRIGDDVRLWAGAKVIGSVAIGDRSEVAANAVVTADVPADTIAMGVPADRHIAKPPADRGD